MFTNLVKGTMVVAGITSLAVAAIVAALCLTEDEEELCLEDKPIFDVCPGDMVQWDSGGTLIFPEPKKVLRLEKSDMGTYVFVEGTKCGIPIHQIVLIRDDQ